MAGRCLIPVIVYAPGRFLEGIAVAALIDTGAMESAISEPIADLLRLPVVGQRMIAAAVGDKGPQYVKSYVATFELLRPGFQGDCWALRDRQIVQMISPMGAVHCLIGMDILGEATLALSGGVWRLSFPA